MLAAVPVIQRFAHCRVCINPRDHPPPHFHVLLKDGREVMVGIDSLTILRGQASRREIAEVLGWAEAHQAWLAITFEELQR